MVGVLQYVTFTHSDITFTITQVCQFMNSPTSMHWLTVKYILRYLKHTIDYDLYLTKDLSSSFRAYFDINWAGDSDDRHFISGFNIFFDRNLISWSAEK